MKQYFISFNSSTGSLAVEKHLYTYIKDNFDHCLVSEENIDNVVGSIREEQDRYFEHHRGQKVNVSVYKNRCNDGMFLNVGQLSASLILIKAFIFDKEEDSVKVKKYDAIVTMMESAKSALELREYITSLFTRED